MNANKIEEFLTAYDEMRTLQKAFFQGDRTVVGQAKAAEKKADKLRQAFSAKAEDKSPQAGPTLLDLMGEGG